MLSERAKLVMRDNAAKLLSLQGLIKLARDPSVAYKHLRMLISDVNMRDHTAAEVAAIYREGVAALALASDALCPEQSAFHLPEHEHPDSTVLGELFKRHGSDKSTVHDYHRIYGHILAGKRNAPLNILEIGLGSTNLDVPSNMGPWGTPGASLRAFRDWAPNAAVFGADVDRRILFQEDRIATFWVDQTDRKSLAALAGQLPTVRFDLIIDDGLHLPHANFNTLTVLLPLLEDQGTLVVEDIEAQHRPFWHIAMAAFAGKYHCILMAAKGGDLFIISRKLADPLAI